MTPTLQTLLMFVCIGALYTIALNVKRAPRFSHYITTPRRVLSNAVAGALIGAALWFVTHGAAYLALQYARAVHA